MSIGSPRRHNTARLTMTGDDVLLYEDADRLFVDPNGSARTITLPAVKQGAFVQITNTADAAETITLNKPDDTALLTIAQGQTKSAICSATAWFEGAGASGGTDSDAIHDNVAAEISAITAKATPVDADYLVIEDSEASDAKKSITLGQVRSAADAGDYTAQSAVMLAPGNATSGDAGDNGITGTWGAVAFGVDTPSVSAQQPNSGNGSIEVDLSLKTVGSLYVTLSDTVVAGADQMVVSANVQIRSSVGGQHALEGNLRLSVAADDDLTTVHSSQDVGNLSYGVWQRVMVKLSNANIKSVGLEMYNVDFGETLESTARSVVYMADVQVMPLTEAMTTVLATTDNDVIVKPDYSPTGTEFPIGELYDANSIGLIDLRKSVRIISDFNGSKYVRQYWIDDTGATDMTETLSRIFAQLEDGDELIFPHNGKIRWDDLGTGTTSPADGAIQIRELNDITIRWNKTRLFSPGDRADAFVRLIECKRVNWYDSMMFGLRSDTYEGSTLTTVTGTPTTNGDDVELNAQNEEVRSNVISQVRTKDLRYEWDVVASDSDQVADDLAWEVRTEDFSLTSNTQKGDTDVTLTDTTVDSWSDPTLTFSTGDMVNDGVQAGMIVYKNNSNYGTIAAGGVAATTLTLENVTGSFSAADTPTIGYINNDGTPYFIDDSASFKEDDIVAGDIIVNETQSTSSVIGSVQPTIINTEDNIAFDKDDTVAIYRRHGSGTFTLTGSQVTYEVRTTPVDLLHEVALHLKKSTATANTITIEEVIAYNRASYRTSKEGADGIEIEDCEDINLYDIHVEGLGGDAIKASTALNRRISAYRPVAIGTARQGISFNWGTDYYIEDAVIIRPGRSGIDIEPFAAAWYVYNAHINGAYIVAPGNYAIACTNWDRIHGMYIENVRMPNLSINDGDGPTNGFINGGAQQGWIRNCTSFYSGGSGEGEFDVRGSDFDVYNNVTHRVELHGTRMRAWNNVDPGGGNVQLSIESDAVDTWALNHGLSQVSVFQQGTGEPFYPIRLIDGNTRSGVISVLPGKLNATYPSTFKAPYAFLKGNVHFADGLDMHAEPFLDAGQYAGRGVTSAGGNVGERNRAADGGVDITGSNQVYYYAFPGRATTNASLDGGLSNPVNNGSGALGDGTYTYMVRNRVEYGGPGGTGATDSGTVANPTTNAYRLYHDAMLTGTTFVTGLTIYRRSSGSVYTHRYDFTYADLGYPSRFQGLIGTRADQFQVNDLGTTIQIDPNGIDDQTINIDTGTVTLTGNTHDGGDNLGYFQDASADFITDGVKVGMLLTNSTDGSTATITAVSPTQLAGTLSGGTDNDFDNNDIITVTKQWSGTEDESGWEPDANYSVFIQTHNHSLAQSPIIYPQVSGFTVDWGQAIAAEETFDYWIVRLPAAS